VVIGDGAEVGAGNELPPGLRIGCHVVLPAGGVRTSTARA
jgi:acetyltransferase-like isoleucine patch superfamily enzyme